MLGYMGNALGTGIDLALALRHRKVIVIESDGSLLLALFNLPTLVNLNPSNLVVFVLDNEAYSGSRINHPSATAGKSDLAALAKTSRIDHAPTVRNIEFFRKESQEALKTSGLRFIVSKVEETIEHCRAERSDMDPLENKHRFERYLERTEGRKIFFGQG